MNINVEETVQGMNTGAHSACRMGSENDTVKEMKDNRHRSTKKISKVCLLEIYVRRIVSSKRITPLFQIT